MAHRDFARADIDPKPPLQIRHVHRWQRACDGLASSFDDVVGAQVVVRIKYFIEAVEEPFITEVRLSELSLVAMPDDPPEKRVGVESSGGGWVGTYTAPEGRIAVVTDVAPTRERARRAALRWVKAGRTDSSNFGYDWRPHPRQVGRYSVFRRGRLGDELVVERA